MAGTRKAKPRSEPTSPPKVWSGEDVQLIKTPDFPIVYANNARISFNSFDGSIIFGEIMDSTGEKLLVTPKVKVTLSIPFCYELLNLLERNLKLVEEQFGFKEEDAV